jgi:hypothetical protein
MKVIKFNGFSDDQNNIGFDKKRNLTRTKSFTNATSLQIPDSTFEPCALFRNTSECDTTLYDTAVAGSTLNYNSTYCTMYSKYTSLSTSEMRRKSFT